MPGRIVNSHRGPNVCSLALAFSYFNERALNHFPSPSSSPSYELTGCKRKAAKVSAVPRVNFRTVNNFRVSPSAAVYLRIVEK